LQAEADSAGCAAAAVGIALLLDLACCELSGPGEFSVSQEALHEAFGISAITFGYLLSAYSWTYAALQLPSGLLLDRFGVRVVGRGARFCGAWLRLLGGGDGVADFWRRGCCWEREKRRRFPGMQGGRVLVSYRGAQPGHGDVDAAAKFASAWSAGDRNLLLHFGWRWSFAATGLVSVLYFVLFIFSTAIRAKTSCFRTGTAIYRSRRGAEEDRRLAQRATGYLLRTEKGCVALGYA